MNLAPPSSQKAAARPISFVLDDQSGSGNGLTSIDLVIRPEELTRTDTSRVTVQQTLGGAWADSFGEGVPTIQISGHTGWRRTESNNEDGVARFQNLHDGVFKQWHQRRRAAAEAGKDPDLVKLVFADALDNFSVVVAPMNFVLRRSRSRPLLAQFQINLTVLDENIDSQQYFQYGKGGKLGYLIRGETAGAGLLESLGLTSLTSSLTSLDGLMKQAKGMLKGALSGVLGPVTEFMNKAKQLYGQVRSAIAAGSALAGQLVGVAQNLAKTGINVFRAIAGVASIPQQAKSWLMGVAGAFSNIFCTLRNAISKQVFVQDYSTMFGSSNCSSTAGGRPVSSLAGKNPFYDVVPTGTTAPISITSAAASAMNFMGRADNVLSAPSLGTVTTALKAINSGVSFVKAFA